MKRTFTVLAVLAMFAVPALAFDPQPEPPKSLAGDGSVRTNLGSIKMGDGSVRIGISR